MPRPFNADMTRFALLLPCLLTAFAAQAQNAGRLGELRTLLQQRPAVTKVPAQPASPVHPGAGAGRAGVPDYHGAAPAASRQLTAEERAELRRQLTEFNRPAGGKGS
jgi:hypothetical protein